MSNPEPLPGTSGDFADLAESTISADNTSQLEGTRISMAMAAPMTALLNSMLGGRISINLVTKENLFGEIHAVIPSAETTWIVISVSGTTDTDDIRIINLAHVTNFRLLSMKNTDQNLQRLLLEAKHSQVLISKDFLI